MTASSSSTKVPVLPPILVMSMKPKKTHNSNSNHTHSLLFTLYIIIAGGFIVVGAIPFGLILGYVTISKLSKSEKTKIAEQANNKYNEFE